MLRDEEKERNVKMINGTGLVKYDNAYFNTNSIAAIDGINHPDPDKGMTQVYLNENAVTSTVSNWNGLYDKDHSITLSVNVEKFANAMIEAQNTGKIVDVMA
ncbi:MAG: hypothetical protein LUH05_08965 [Candidatus Gastranaerophilales bacterium]|nr:hypothetical protein [Candidatus Gastranaerophilales bacterium]